MSQTIMEPLLRRGSYLSAVALLAGQAVLRPIAFAQALAIDDETAWVFLAHMRASGLLGAPLPDGGWPVLPDRPASPLLAEVIALEAALGRLYRAVEASRNAAQLLRDRLAAAERRLGVLQDRLAAPASASGDARWFAVKRLLARELHPDLPGNAQERVFREALFKRIWPKLDAIEQGAGGATPTR